MNARNDSQDVVVVAVVPARDRLHQADVIDLVSDSDSDETYFEGAEDRGPAILDEEYHPVYRRGHQDDDVEDQCPERDLHPGGQQEDGEDDGEDVEETENGQRWHVNDLFPDTEDEDGQDDDHDDDHDDDGYESASQSDARDAAPSRPRLRIIFY
ncbi:prostatic spermine-binding protein-like [Thrips palmi]|uniref:Prostatic spermine-binding protein-like n=1 Tax=Thrips palmi TaxID=161013 RepID=A0A6P8ZTD8_THRPL|nr:prostatic spermine-binding protein-like [Thrips palmi]